MFQKKKEAKYKIPEHKRKKRKENTSPIVPKEFDTIYHVLAAPKPDAMTAPDPFPYVRWFDVRSKPALPAPERCPVYSCSPDPAFYVEKSRPLYNGTYNFDSLVRQYGQSFIRPIWVRWLSLLPRWVAMYTALRSRSEWVIHAEPRSSPASAGRGTRRGGAMSLTRRRS